MRIITEKKLATFKAWLMEQEMATGSLQNYLRYVRSFAAFAEGHEVDHELVVSWKAYLQQKGNQAATVNAKLVGLNAFFKFVGWENCRVKLLCVQKRAFRSTQRDLSKKEYERLRDTAWEQGRTRLALLIETIGATGVRVSETQYFTVESVRRGMPFCPA